MRCLTSLVVAALVLPCGAGAQSPRAGSPTADSAAVVAIIESVRGANPVLCELAARSVENQWGWGGQYDLRATRDPLARAALEVSRGHRPPPAAVAPLAAALRDGDACVRRVAAPLLGRVRTPAALAALRTALRDEHADAREAAAIGLGYSEDRSTIPALLAGIQDAEPRVRAASAWALGEIEDARAIGALVRLLREDRDATVRAAAAWALGSIEG